MDQNIQMLIDSFKIYFNHVVQTQQLNLNEFVQFMEPRFAAAGYRQNTTPPQKWRQNNILIITDCGAGDFVVTSGAIREIRRLYPNDHITLSAQLNFGNLPELCPYVDEVLIRPLGYNPMIFGNFFIRDIEFAAPLLERKFDVCFNFGHWIGEAFLSYMSGAKLRITFDRNLKDPYQRFKDDDPLMELVISVNTFTNYLVKPDKFFDLHAVNIAFSLVDGILGVPVANRELEIWYSPFEFSQAKNLLNALPGKIYAMCFGGTSLKKHYPPEMYAKLVEMILNEDPTATFILLGGGKIDSDSAKVFEKSLDEKYQKNILNLIERTNYRQTAAILKLCDMYIGNDTSTVHIAAAVKCPVLVQNCFPLDIPKYYNDIPRIFSPYMVPSVTIQPKHALPECASNTKHDQYGCVSGIPHCITQIKPESIFRGFKLLQQRIAENNIEPLFIY